MPSSEEARSGPGFTIITGLSGAGRSEAAKCLEDLGYFVIRFGYQEDWSSKIAQYPTIFGRPV